MISWLLSFLLAMTPAAPWAQESNGANFEIRARENLLLGKGEKTAATYYDVVITRQPTAGVLIKLPYTTKGAIFSFDLHHRLAMTDDFGEQAEVTTVVEVLTGGTTSIGTYTLSGPIKGADRFDEKIIKTSAAEIDQFITPMGRKSVTLEVRPGPQSISIVGQTLLITRGTTTTRIDTPGTRIATVSNFKFEPITERNPLKKSTPDPK